MHTASVYPTGGELLGGRYRLLEPIGSGGMSVVWRVHDQVLDRMVAIKMLLDAADEQLRQRLRDEAQACGRLNSPRVARVYDYGEVETADGVSMPYLVMELVDGEPLSRLLTGDTRLPWAQATEVCAQVAEALCDTHAFGLVHRDVKPANVIMTATGVKLVDFGISAPIGSTDADQDGYLLGTPAYVAPERIAGQLVGTAADMYALGVLLYVTLAGTLPWPADTSAELLKAQLGTDPAPLPPIDGLPAEVAALCAACLDTRPKRRPSSAQAARVLGLASSAVHPTVPVIERAATERAVIERAVIERAVIERAVIERAVAGAIGARNDTVPMTLAVRRRRHLVPLVAAVASAALLAAAWTSSDSPRAAPAAVPQRPDCGTELSVVVGATCHPGVSGNAATPTPAPPLPSAGVPVGEDPGDGGTDGRDGGDGHDGGNGRDSGDGHGSSDGHGNGDRSVLSGGSR